MPGGAFFSRKFYGGRDVRWWRPGGRMRHEAAARRPPGGGRAKIENSSRRHPRKFSLKRFLAVKRSWRRKWGSPVFGLPPWKKYRRGDRDHLVPPNVGWKQQSPAVRRRA